MSLTEIERPEIAKAVVSKFQIRTRTHISNTTGQEIQRTGCVRPIGTVRNSQIPLFLHVQFFPTALAFQYSGEEVLQNLARESVQIVLDVLQHLFEVDEEEKEYLPCRH